MLLKQNEERFLSWLNDEENYAIPSSLTLVLFNNNWKEVKPFSLTKAKESDSDSPTLFSHKFNCRVVRFGRLDKAKEI